MSKNFSSVTELAGEEISNEQLMRMHHRYSWALPYCQGKSVVEVACGTGQGLGMIARVSKDLAASDYDENILTIAKKHYSDDVKVEFADAKNMPYENHSKDVVIIFEAIYYLPDVESFLAECVRILKPGGTILIATANKDLLDFNPSPFSFSYYGVLELDSILEKYGFNSSFFGYMEIEKKSSKQKIFQLIKRMVIFMGVMPKTMAGKKLLKRIVFGKLVTMPFELVGNEFEYLHAKQLIKGIVNYDHKVIYCSASLKKR